MHPGCYYHVYNRGINGEQLFKQPRNYGYFLDKYAKYIEPIATTYAYVLMGNHFHFFIGLKQEETIRQQFPLKSETPIELVISQQFARLFNGYAQAINKQEKRTGALFEDTFRRIPVGTEVYAAQMVYYIHRNPKKHTFVTDFKDYPHSSYRAFTMPKESTRIPREVVFDWFGGRDTFFAYHGEEKDFGDDWCKDFWVEVD